MEYQNRKTPSRPKRPTTTTSKTSNGDPFFEPDPKRQRRRSNDEDLESLPSDDEDRVQYSNRDEEPAETAGPANIGSRASIWRRFESRPREWTRRKERREREEVVGRSVSLITGILQKRQLEESGRVRRLIAARETQGNSGEKA